MAVSKSNIFPITTIPPGGDANRPVVTINSMSPPPLPSFPNCSVVSFTATELFAPLQRHLPHLARLYLILQKRCSTDHLSYTTYARLPSGGRAQSSHWNPIFVDHLVLTKGYGTAMLQLQMIQRHPAILHFATRGGARNCHETCIANYDDINPLSCLGALTILP